MRPGRGPAPTRSNLLRLRRRLSRVRKGVDLLTRKRQALVSELFRVATPAIEARGRVEAVAIAAWPTLVEALAVEGGDVLALLGRPRRHLEVEVLASELWGVTTGTVTRRTPVRRSLARRSQAPGLTGPAAAIATDRFEELLEQLLDAASSELLLRRLAEALARTSRQVNTLERRVEPELVAAVGRIRGVLEEREREDAVRLRWMGEGRGERGLGTRG